MLQKNNAIDQYQISISMNHDYSLLKKYWLNIESSTDIPFFLSWAWISTWINSYQPTYYTVIARFNNQVVAIGLLTSSTERRHFVINAKQLRLNQTGDNSEDQIWVEYNDFICFESHKTLAVNACLKFLLNEKLFNSHDEVIFSMISEGRAKSIKKAIPKCEILFTRPCYSVDLKKTKAINSSYLQTLKSNTRYQIRRSIRHYEKLHGALELVHSNTTEQALQFFKETAPLHIERWYDSGYKNSNFTKFHHQLITNYYKENRVHLIKVNAGSITIAILYYLIKGKTISFYLQGLLYEQDKMLKPGLVAHALATQYFIDKDMEIYDYMGGYSQYKSQLASRSEDLATIRIQKPILKFILENTAQTVKKLITREKNVTH